MTGLKMNVIYIGGYGRSGSTLLGTILGNHTSMMTLGEVVSLPAMERKEMRCSCGATLNHCPFYGEIFSEIKQQCNMDRTEIISLCRQAEHRSVLWRCIQGRFKQSLAKDYRTAMNLFFKGVRKRSGKGIIVDSSKSASGASGRAIALSKLCHYDVKLIHVVRDGRGVIWSLMRGSNRMLEDGTHGEATGLSLPTLRAIYGWVTANVVAFISGKVLGKDRYLLVRYEDFVANPEPELRRIGAFLQIDMSQLIHTLQENGSFDIGHQVGGNRLRHSGAVRLKCDSEWKQRLPLRCHLLFWLLAGPVALFYGYRIKKRCPVPAIARSERKVFGQQSVDSEN